MVYYRKTNRKEADFMRNYFFLGGKPRHETGKNSLFCRRFFSRTGNFLCDSPILSVRITKCWRRFHLLSSVLLMIFYSVNQQIKTQIHIPVLGYLLRCHFNDYLGAFLFFCYLNLMISISCFKQVTALPQILFMTAICGFWWEGIAPILHPNSTADPWDLVAYLLGALSYWGMSQWYATALKSG